MKEKIFTVRMPNMQNLDTVFRKTFLKMSLLAANRQCLTTI